MRVSSNSAMTDAQGAVFGAEMARLRKEAGFTTKDFAELVGCSFTYVSNLEHGKRKPSPQFAERVANIFGLKVSDMLVSNDERAREFRQKYGAVLKEHREAKGLPVSVVAGALGIPPYIYKEYEQGLSSITEREMNMLGKLLDIGKKPEVVKEKVIVEVPADIPTEICNTILEHIKDLQIDECAQKVMWRYFSQVKLFVDERRLFGKEG